jgi:hypothetical protein
MIHFKRQNLILNFLSFLLIFLITQSFSLAKNTQKINIEVKVSTVQEVLEAVKIAKPGDVILVQGGEYLFDKRIDIKISGTPADKIIFMADKKSASRPKFNFTALPEGDSNQGIILRASNWHIKGIDIFNTGDNGLLIAGGSNNIIEFCTFSECSDTGLQLVAGAANNLILNCDSYHNADSKIENADGFACKIDAGTGNKFEGCRAWQNLDDGWDGYLKNTDNITTTYINCWAFNNGQLKDGKPSGGDGNGFKSGGSDDKLLKHNAFYENCISAGNLKKGFDHNSNRGSVTLINCKAYNNLQANMGFGSKNPLSKLTIKNSLVFGELGGLNAEVKDIENNSWQNSLLLKASDFKSLDMEELFKPRKADGSLPEVAFLKLK